MTDTNHLCDLWEHTIAKGFKHDSKSQLGLMLKQWIIFNKLENFNSILNYTIDDFTPSGNLSYMNQYGDILHHTPLREVYNLRCYIQHLMDESEDETQTFEEIFKNQHEKLESNEEEHKSTTSSDKSEQDSESDITTEDEQETNTTETHQVHNVLNETTHDEENVSEAEDDTSHEENVIQMQIYENNQEQNIQNNKLLTTNFEVKLENRKVEGLITYSTDQQIFKLKVNSGTDQQEVWGVYIDFQSIHSKWMIDAILQHMGFYATTENPNVMMRENHNTQSSEYIIISQDGLFIVSTTPDETFYMLKDKYKINIYLQDKYPHDPGGRDICHDQIKKYLEHLYENMNILLNNKFPTELHTEFHIIKLLIEKGNLNLIHHKSTYKHFKSMSRKRKLNKLYNEM